MTDLPVGALRARLQEIDARLGAAADPAQRETLKREIAGLFKQVDGALTELAQLKEDIRGLVERYKQLVAAAGAAPVSASVSAPPFVGGRPAVQVDHLGASTYIEKGWSLISLGDHVGAVQALERALTLAPGSTQAQSLLGWAQMLGERYEEALATFSEVLMAEPDNALARVNLGYVCLRKGIFGEAIEHLSNAIRLDNDRKATLYAHYYLGLLYFQREMYEDAQAFLQKALRLGPNLIEAYYDLGRALWFAGRRAEALEVWETGRQANRFNPWAKRCGEIAATAVAGGTVPLGFPT